MSKTQTNRFVAWWDEWALLILSSILLAFIPLYPKLPLFDAIPGYLVRVRIEDFLVLFTVIIWLIQVLRKKVTFVTWLTWPIVIYAVIGLLSTISAVLITQTVPAQFLHISKTSLHYFRYLEYFSLYFILVSSIKKLRHLEIVLATIVITLLLVTAYGIGQKYWYWPVYSTMNREFAKGLRLILTEHARVQSTFGGHYDLAAYVVIVTPLILALRLIAKQRWVVWLLNLALISAIWLLMVSSARSSLGGFWVGAMVVIIGFAWLQKTKKQRWLSFTKVFTLFLLANVLMVRFFGEGLFERVEQTIDAYPPIAEPYHTVISTVQKTSETVFTYIDPRQAPWIKRQSDAVAKIVAVEKPANAITIDEVLVSSDTQPEPARPVDVYTNIPVSGTYSATASDGSTYVATITAQRTYSAQALKHGLSLAIRLDTLWPRALAGFSKNPLLGSGYATLTKDTVAQFTEAESTDNNFLRTLGEIGGLGFLTFYGTIGYAIWLTWGLLRTKKPLHPLIWAVALGYLGASVGLLSNALLIDVYAASKVAFYFWAFTGLVLALKSLHERQSL